MIFNGFTSESEAQISVAPRDTKSPVQIDETVILVDEKPVFVRSIQYNGESFKFLKSLGFNAIQLSAPATDEQLKAATDVGIGLICPPPSAVRFQAVDRSYRSVLAWSIGEKQTGRDFQLMRRAANEAREYDRYKRPIVANMESDWNSLSQVLDIVSVGSSMLGTDLPANKYSQFVSQIAKESSKPVWVDIQTEVSRGLADQVVDFLGRDVALPIEHQQLKFLLYEAVTGGARGIRFLSKSKLDSNDPLNRLRASGLRWLLQHCQQIEYWISAGLVERQKTAMPGDLEVHTIKVAGSRLFLIQRTTGFEQWTCGDVSPATIQIFAPANLNDRTYRINERGAHPIAEFYQSSRTYGSIPACPFTGCVLMTQDPVAVQEARQFADSDPAYIQNRIELAEQSLAYYTLVEQRIASTGIGMPVLGDARMKAETALTNARQMTQKGNKFEALRQLERLDFELANAKRQVLNQQKVTSAAKVSSPLVRHIGLVADHLNQSVSLAGATWNPNSLAGGDFENLEQMLKAGWINRKDESDSLSTVVELEKSAAVDGSYGLKLSVVPNGPIPNRLQRIPVWIRSANIAVKRGQLIRINGFVNVENVSASDRGLTITDSIGGDDLAVHFQKTDGWQEFTIYRAARRNGDLNVTFAMTGVGSAMIDEVTIRTMDRPEFSEQANVDNRQIK